MAAVEGALLRLRNERAGGGGGIVTTIAKLLQNTKAPVARARFLRMMLTGMYFSGGIPT